MIRAQRWLGLAGSARRLAPSSVSEATLPLVRQFTSATPSDRPSEHSSASSSGSGHQADPGQVSEAQQAAATHSTGQQGAGQQGPGQADERQPPSASSSHWQSTVNRREAEKFAKFSGEWWAPDGPFKPLHRMNPVRVRFIRSALCDHFGLDLAAAQPLQSLRVLDLGCGGGILSEGLAALGAQVTGVDVNEAAVAAATVHSAADPALEGLLTYRVGTAEQLAQEGEQFDAVIASEVIEHVKSLPHFCASLAALARPGGAVVVTTLNRTPRSLALAVVAAEYVLRWVPAGTHDWTKFLTPEELCMAMEDSSGGQLRLEQMAGMTMNPLTVEWLLGTDTSINYAAFFSKQP